MPRIWVYRHAESLSNAGAKTLDPEGIPLTEHGLQQAEALAASIPEAPQLIVASPFRRTLDTARPIRARFPEATYEVWPIQEFTYLEPGSCVGTSWVERKPRIDVYWEKLDPDYIDGLGAENFASLLGRARTFLADLAELENELTVVVSHGQFMQAAGLMAERPELDSRSAMAMFRDLQEQHSFANCERMELVMRQGRPRLAASGAA